MTDIRRVSIHRIAGLVLVAVLIMLLGGCYNVIYPNQEPRRSPTPSPSVSTPNPGPSPTPSMTPSAPGTGNGLSQAGGVNRG